MPFVRKVNKQINVIEFPFMSCYMVQKKTNLHGFNDGKPDVLLKNN